jgi:uncharacterized protein (DUF1501 family)
MLPATFRRWLDAALTGFLDSVEGRPVVVAVYSEFGRRVEANASQGTDHGPAGTMLIAGSPVRGGFYGEQPSLTTLRDGDLAVTTDFPLRLRNPARGGPRYRC